MRRASRLLSRSILATVAVALAVVAIVSQVSSTTRDAADNTLSTALRKPSHLQISRPTISMRRQRPSRNLFVPKVNSKHYGTTTLNAVTMCGRDRQNARLASILPPSASGTTETPETPSRPKVMISNKLDWLGHYTQIVPDSFAFGGTQYQPKSGTVSGLLILRLLEQKGQQFIDEEISRALSASIESVSLEVDPRLSHDANSIVEEVRALAKILDKHDVDVKSKILFKIPGTWEGILAAKMLTLQEEFSCQVTHVYSMAQATAAADAKVAVIQPYVGRINDWHRCNNADTSSHADKGGDNHGVVLAKKIYNFIHKYELPTKVMAASIRNVKDAISLAGIDYMVLSPLLIKSLASEPGSFEPPVLTPDRASSAQFSPQEIRGSELGECAETLLEASIKASSEAIEKVEEVLANTAIGNL